MSSSPVYRAFTVRKAKQDDKKDVWIAIGAAWPHRDEQGIDIILDALPIDGHIVLRLADSNNGRTGAREPPERPQYGKKPMRAGERGGGQRWPRR